jgi:ATP-dependent Clp protease adaptor protein ClpS
VSRKKLDKKSDIGVLDREKRKVQKPKKYKAVMYNDDFTPMDFVVVVLTEIFHKPFDQAWKLMLDVHEKGRGIAGVYTKEICETKCAKANQFAKSMGHPFLVQPEQE